jgi:hypothetical protein
MAKTPSLGSLPERIELKSMVEREKSVVGHWLSHCLGSVAVAAERTDKKQLNKNHGERLCVSFITAIYKVDEITQRFII